MKTADDRANGSGWLLHAAHYLAVDAQEWTLSKLCNAPALRARALRAGERLSVASFPRIRGAPRIAIGDGCMFSTFDVDALGASEIAELEFGNACFVANDTAFKLARGISIGNHVGIGAWVEVRDVDSRGVAPVTIEDHVWIGRGAYIGKGVTIGEGATVAAGSVVLTDVPRGSLAMGSPARVIPSR